MIPKKQTDKTYKKNLVGKKALVKTKGQTFQGKIILETKNTLKIKTQNQEKTIIKKNATIKINDKEINGKKITKRTEERIKQR
ncbi:ribonuclease P protein subunit [Candidatus Woesearchaeota archaeon]|nr:ribonuclease P protein subunit [Candidatus Woesearchaeota archaeon]